MMNHFIDYIYRGIARSEDAICRLNKNMVSLAKRNKKLGTAVICLGVAGMVLTAVVESQRRDIEALQNQVDGLTKDMEELNQQKGA